MSARRPVDFTVELNGSTGTLFFDYARLNELWYGSADDDAARYGLQRIRAEHPDHPYTRGWWPIGQGIGYDASFVNESATFWSAGPSAPGTPTSRREHGRKQFAKPWSDRPRKGAGSR